MATARWTADLNQLPFHWHTSGDPAVVQEVNGYSNESHAIIRYFRKHMPRDTEVTRIRRIENRALLVPYKAYREMVQNTLTECAEMWLWHGTDTTIEALSLEDFSTAHSSLEDNFYGSGSYFACDPRLAAWFQKGSRGHPEGQQSLVLARVVVGWCGERAAIKRHLRGRSCRCTRSNLSPGCKALQASELRKPENRKPPAGCHSATSEHRLEIVVYQDCHCYPAYIVDYTSPSLAFFGNPYEVPQRYELEWLNFRDRSLYQVDFEHVRIQAVSLEAEGCRQCGGNAAGQFDREFRWYCNDCWQAWDVRHSGMRRQRQPTQHARQNHRNGSYSGQTSNSDVAPAASSTTVHSHGNLPEYVLTSPSEWVWIASNELVFHYSPHEGDVASASDAVPASALFPAAASSSGAQRNLLHPVLISCVTPSWVRAMNGLWLPRRKRVDPNDAASFDYVLSLFFTIFTMFISCLCYY